MSNTETVRRVYAAFQRGDVPAILSCLSATVEWEYGSNSAEVPWLIRRHGHEGAAAFFASLSAIEIHQFEVKAVLEAKSIVVGLIDIDFTVRSTGKRVIEEDEVHIFHFGADGKVNRFRHRVDTRQHQLACSF